MPTLILTGTVWPISEADEFDIDALPGWRPGDISLSSRLDASGRRNAKYGPSEARLSGYLTGYLLQGRGRRNIPNWRVLFPGAENCFAEQASRDDAEQRVRRIVEGIKGRSCRKVIGGWEIDLPPAS